MKMKQQDKQASKFAIKLTCHHYAGHFCKILTSSQTGKLNCQLCKCSFFETTEAYNKHQAKFNERGASEAEKIK